jgi:hypothetical protein
MEKSVFIPSVLVDQLKLTILQIEVCEKMFWQTFKEKCVEDEYNKVLGEGDLEEEESHAATRGLPRDTPTEGGEPYSLSAKDEEFIEAFVNLPPMPMEYVHYEKKLSLVTDKDGTTVGYVVTSMVKRREAKLPLASAHLFHPNLLKAVEYFKFAVSFLYPQRNAILDDILSRHRR